VDVVVLIPAKNPDGRLPTTVDALAREGFGRIVVVDDGSDPRCRPVFAALERDGRCEVLRHAVNLGKGRALKTGLNHILLAHPEAAGILTVDADGQHLPADVAKVAARFAANPKALVIGSRRFGAGTPLRSLLGNVITRHVFHILVGRRISDTQSGLRCIPAALAPLLLSLEGEGFEYEMNVLIATRPAAVEVLEEEISTVYLESNRSSHFRPLLDSMRIYFLLLRFASSSALAALVDFLVFITAYRLGGDLLLSLALARVAGGSLNFSVNRSLVFHSRAGLAATLAGYGALFLALGACAYLSIRALAGLGMNVVAAKALTETALFLASFAIQREFIFSARRGDSP
jgi:glycosyltransferase involved in cell wall biosynthesis